MTIGEAAGDGLDGAPGELTDGQSKADGGNPQAGGAVQRIDKKSQGLTHAHGHHQNPGRR